ncbi:MAG: XRE family transcriptional regulator [Actinomycetaceae bacterium]|nr:XRE family transcriptional regulator [Actinomycetaceae bacterium]
MTVSRREILASLPKERRRRIEARAAELRTLRDLRLAVEQTQQQVASKLGIEQNNISRMERRSDMLLSTLRRYVECLGGRLELVAHFPNQPPTVISRLGASTT